MLKEFKEFAMRGNVMDMAVGIIIGAAFGKIVTSLVNDVIMPPIGLLMGNVDFSNLFVNLTMGADLRERRGSRSRRRADHQVRHLHQHRARLRDRRVRDLPGHPRAQQAEEQAGSGAAAGAARLRRPRKSCSRRFATCCKRAEPLTRGTTRPA